MSFCYPLNIIVEDVVSKAVMSRLLAYLRFSGCADYRVTQGNVRIRANIPKYKGASRVAPHIILTDLDRYPCSTALLEEWHVGALPPDMILRIAVREVESWLMSDRQGIASFLHVAFEKVPAAPESVDFPKQALFSVIRKSRRKRLVEEMVPQAGAHIGPLYNDHLCNFTLNYWNIETAAENAPSLSRSLSRIEEFLVCRPEHSL